ncbi:Uma2 family endonuclease [Pseudanabaena sp. FACHB-1277]|uniref:Uma2 family endonuclease n=1 Tax=Pseudanabaena cinerea FACHB-1277 TaxID=2949581 RepID=A0A926UX97_9CYAN|nr:Uma2 family endonuclease [Pseudanabaena cinerea]MBD2152820.1 Uma2 family endonuclease [Pseudanabaena cinerea FACHB-1277]
MVTIPFENRQLPTAEDLPSSDETPVDNELQNDIPNMLLNLLRSIWSDRQDWFWGVDMCYYYEANIEEPKKSKSIVPDGFLAISVPRLKDEGGRLSYVLWQEQVKPIMVLEVISKEYNGEYDQKLTQYQDLGILYYVVYNSLSGRRGRYKRHESLEVYKLIDEKYELLPSVALLSESGKVVWMPEIGLGIGCERRVWGNWEREWLYWYDRDNVRYPSAEERAERERIIARQERMIASQERIAKQEAEAIASQQGLIAQQEREQKEKLANYLRSIGINPDEI